MVTALNTHGVPVVALAGTCMDSGKTAAASAIVSRLRHLGHTVDAFKATGVSLRRDILAMEDAGARNTSIFTDFGVITTTAQNSAGVTKTMLNKLAATKPDAIVFELGDGILGTYGVDAILQDQAIAESLTCLILCANDPVGSTGGHALLKDEFGLDAHLVTGPATDNQVGRNIINDRLGIQGINAITNASDLGDAVAGIIGLAEQQKAS